MNSLSWRLLIGLAESKFREVPKKTCVYVVFWVRDGKPVVIPRIRGFDERGILYIGSAKNLRKRIRNLWISIQIVYEYGIRKKIPHTFGRSLIYTGLHEVIARQELYIYLRCLAKRMRNIRRKQHYLNILGSMESPTTKPQCWKTTLHSTRFWSSG